MQRVQTHCIVDCFAYVLREAPFFDPRPLYFGVWDSPFAITDEGHISYFSKSITAESKLDQFEQLFGKKMTSWCDFKKDKKQNYQMLIQQMAEKPKESYVIVLVDLYYLQYPNQCYKVKHAPHIVILEHLDMKGSWVIKDPYFGWEGCVSDEIMFDAFQCRDLIAGFTLHKEGMRIPKKEIIRNIFEASILLESWDLFKIIKEDFIRALHEDNNISYVALSEVLSQIGIVVKRKNSYQFAFSFFSDALKINHQGIEATNKLMKRWNNFSLQIVRLGIVPNQKTAQGLLEILLEIESMESEIKKELWLLYKLWTHSIISDC